HLAGPLTRTQSDALADRIATHFAVHGYGLWVVEAEGAFAGFTGLQWSEVTGARELEVGWRLARWAWGRGWATEAGRAALDVGLRQAPQVVSFTAVGNLRSVAVMERLGMRRVREFDSLQPGLPDRVRRHVLYVTP
ncbi:MAG: GNAT family N-acetyltransferase, partial [Nocardioidaceae bacterium]